MAMPSGLHGWPEDGQNSRGLPIYSARQQYRLGQVVRGSDLKLYQAVVEYPMTDPVGGSTADWQSFPPILKRRWVGYFAAPSTSFTASPDLSQVILLPSGEDGNSVLWLPASMTLYCSGVTSGSQSCTAQVAQNSGPGNSGSPTNVSNTLTLTASAQAFTATTTFPGGVTVPSGNFLYVIWTNNLNMSGVWLEIELQAQSGSN